jgi:hypothetical protein
MFNRLEDDIGRSGRHISATGRLRCVSESINSRASGRQSVT